MYKVVKEFKGSPDGSAVILFKEGDKLSVEKHGQDLVDVALREKWVVAEKPSAPAKTEEQLKAEALKKAESKVANLTKALDNAKPEKKAEIQTKLDVAKADLAKLKG
jgi:enolase